MLPELSTTNIRCAGGFAIEEISGTSEISTLNEIEHKTKNIKILSNKTTSLFFKEKPPF
jgi:hypothetical protein